jgi:excisionase family DNA binding protein
MGTSELQSVDYASKRIGVTVARFYDLIHSGIIPSGVVVRLGRHLRINPEKLEQFIDGGGQGLPGGWRREAQ